MSLNLGEPVQIVNGNGNGYLTGTVHEIRFDSRGDELVIVRVGDKLTPPLPAYWWADDAAVER